MALIVFFSLIWSSAFIVGKIPVTEIGAVGTLLFRFLISSIVLLPVCIFHPVSLWHWKTVRTGIMLGLLNNVLYLGLTFTAMNYISASLVVIIVSCAPFMAMVFASLNGTETISMKKILGTLIALCGVIVVTRADASGVSLPGILFAVSGTAAFAYGTVSFHKSATSLSMLHLNFWQSLTAVPVLLLILPFLPHALILPTLISAAAIFYLALAVTIGGMGLWLILIRRNGASTAASYHLLNPVSGLLLSAILLGTPIEPRAILGAIIIAAGLYITNRQQ
ncbi:DMT family transporter [Gynuella sunshinyii]|uniref:EamA domain-containing protein n=1 Tax=Gynuella sunshinyii YC6258 TaxID=1445510 RepID=A0A0C5VFL8_9GAMM|nr:DMT family transporter [Gynuella sunshinyii]AJQ93352.1 hypothetical Protein YC6258_01304 [Gynuella sunshinyii YC6258]